MTHSVVLVVQKGSVTVPAKQLKGIVDGGLGVGRFFTPKALWRSAQGCRAAATLGNVGRITTTLSGLCPLALSTQGSAFGATLGRKLRPRWGLPMSRRFCHGPSAAWPKPARWPRRSGSGITPSEGIRRWDTRRRRPSRQRWRDAMTATRLSHRLDQRVHVTPAGLRTWITRGETALGAPTRKPGGGTR